MVTKTLTFGKSGTRPYGVLTVEETATSTANNTSTLKITLVLKRQYQIYSTAEKSASCTINGTTYTWSGTIGGVGDKTLISKTQTVTHNSNGQKTIDISAKIRLEITHSGTYIGTISGSDTMTLTNIPRYATVTQSLISRTETTAVIKWVADATIDYIWYSTNNGATWTGIDVADGNNGQYTLTGLTANTTYQVKTKARRKDSQLTTISSALAVATYAYPYANNMPNFVIGEKLSIGLFNPLGRTVTVDLIGADNSLINSDVVSGTSCTGYILEEIQNRLYQSIPNSISGTYSVKVTYGSIETLKTGGTYTVDKSVCNPTITNASYADTNTVSVAITGNNQKIVRNQSIVGFTANGIAAKKYASISQVEAKIGGISHALTYSDGSATGDYGTVDSGTDIDAQIIVTDSRGVITTQTITLSMVNWSVPSGIVTLQRQLNYYSETDIKCNADYTNIGTNTVTITYAATKDGDLSPSVSGTLQDDVASVVVLDNNYSWTVLVTIIDSFGGSAAYTAYISRGMPIIYFDRLKSSVGFNCFPDNQKSVEIDGDLYVNGEQIADYIVERGTSGIWTDEKYASGDVVCSGQYSIESTSITWNAYLSTGLNYGNTRVPYPFNIADAIITATMNYCGGNVGWVSTANAYDNTQTSITIVRNGNAGTLTVNINVRGKWR